MKKVILLTFLLLAVLAVGMMFGVKESFVSRAAKRRASANVSFLAPPKAKASPIAKKALGLK
jgi:hypothetical protein